ncbi:MAG: hypothetical protein U0572_11770 [Phycisphaerales bacterium]
MLVALAACGSSQSDRGGAALGTAQAAAVLDRPRSRGEDDGLELTRWSVSADDARIRQALGRHALRTVPIGVSAAALEQYGLRAAVVRDADLPSVLAELGGTTTAVATWHGQVPEWREMASAPLGMGRVVMVDGRAERLGGTLRCMGRGWTVPTEDGAVFELHVATQLVANPTEASLVLNRETLRGRVFDAATIRADMPAASALLLVGAPPAQPSDDDDPEAPSSPERHARTGPPGVLPPTIGEALFTDEAAVPPRRIVLVLRVRLPDTLFPTSAPAPRVAPAAPAPPPPPDPKGDPDADPEGPPPMEHPA